MKILVATTDIMPQRGLLPIVEELERRGHNVVIAADGKSAGLWKKAIRILVFEGIEKDYAKESYLGVSQLLIENETPDLILVGCSTPNNLESEIAQMAMAKSIPVVAYSDIWNSVNRLHGVTPNLVLAMDTFDAECYSVRHRLASTIVGHPVTRELADRKHKPSGELYNEVMDPCEGRTPIILVGQGLEYTPEMVNVFIDSLMQTRAPDRFAVIPKLVHPKYKDNPEAAATMEAFSKLDRSFVIEPKSDWDTDKLVQIMGTITVSVFSTVLLNAVVTGNRGISIMSPQCKVGMEKSLGIPTFPLMAKGLASQITTPISLDNVWIEEATFNNNRREYVEEITFKPDYAAEAIEQLVK